MSVLHSILDSTRTDLARARAQVPYDAVAEAAAAETTRRPPVDVTAALSGPGLAVIAEVKRRSPSVGDLADIPDPAELARTYAAAGAAMISVLTEPHRFAGSLDDLRAVRAAVSVAVLRKDFIVDVYQVAQARAAGADAVLLIVAALTDELLASLLADVRRWGMTPLVEVHDEAEAARAVAAGADVIGVNARNLATLDVDPATFGRVVPHLGGTPVLVAESGIANAEDAAIVAAQGAHAVLVGQALVQSADPARLITQLRTVGG